MIFISSLFLISFCFGGGQSKSNTPLDKGDARRSTQDGTSWFGVKSDAQDCLGELTFDGKTYDVCYEFENFDLISVYVLDIENKEEYEDALCFSGKVKLKFNKTVIELHKENESSYIETFVFKKRNDFAVL